MGYNVPVRHLQGGSVLEVGPSGTIRILAGGSLTNAGGLSLGSDVSFSGTVSIGGTAGRWAFGSATLDSGTQLVYTGLSQIVAVSATPLKASPGTATTSPSSFQIDPSRFANGTFYALGLAGTFGYAGAGTFVWNAFGL